MAKMNTCVQGKVVIVTGAGSGIGRALAVGFARDGARVWGIGRNGIDLASMAAAAAPGVAQHYCGDIGQLSDLRDFIGQVEAREGRVDVLINNAAVYPRAPFLDLSPENWAETVQVNVIGLAQACRLVLPGMLVRGHGRVLNVGSFAWRGPIPGSSGYSASKAAVSVLTKSIALEIDRARHPDVLVNEFIPGIYRTRMSDTGDDPSEAYPLLRSVVALPAGSPSGATYLRGELVTERRSRLGRVRDAVRKLLTSSRAGS